MDTLWIIGPCWTGFHDAVTDCHHRIKGLALKYLEMPGNGLAHVNAHLFHDASSQGMNLFGRLTSRTVCLDRPVTHIAKKCLGHLRTCAVLGTEKEHTQRRGRHLWQGRVFPQRSDSGMDH